MNLLSIQLWAKSLWMLVYVLVVALAVALVLKLAFIISDTLAPFLIVDGDGLWGIIPR